MVPESGGSHNADVSSLGDPLVRVPAQALTREQLVTAHTGGSAYAEFADGEKSTLTQGLLADLAVLSQDIFTVPVPALPATHSVLTLLGARAVHDEGLMAARRPARGGSSGSRRQRGRHHARKSCCLDPAGFHPHHTPGPRRNRPAHPAVRNRSAAGR
jgi:Amidohydrolase family